MVDPTTGGAVRDDDHERATEGDGFDAFCREAHPRVVGALSHLCGDGAIAEELAQEALIRAHQRWERVRTLASPLGWTVHVGANLARSHLRRRAVARRLRPTQLDPDRGTHRDPDVADAVAVRRAVASLPHAQREAVVLRHVVGLTPAQIGEVVGADAAAVRKRCERGLAALRDALGDEPAAPAADHDDQAVHR